MYNVGVICFLVRPHDVDVNCFPVRLYAIVLKLFSSTSVYCKFQKFLKNVRIMLMFIVFQCPYITHNTNCMTEYSYRHVNCVFQYVCIMLIPIAPIQFYSQDVNYFPVCPYNVNVNCFLVCPHIVEANYCLGCPHSVDTNSFSALPCNDCVHGISDGFVVNKTGRTTSPYVTEHGQ